MSSPTQIQILALLSEDKLFKERTEFLVTFCEHYSLKICNSIKELQKAITEEPTLLITQLTSSFPVDDLLDNIHKDHIFAWLGLCSEECDIVAYMENGFTDVVMHNNLRHLALVIERELAVKLTQMGAQQGGTLHQYSDFTGVHARLEFLEFITQYNPTDEISAIVYIQLDNFTWINENVGMTAGDTYLKDIGKLLLNILPETDFPARYQGGNFVALLTAEDHKLMKSKADMIRESILELSTEFRDTVISSTASLGVREFSTEVDLLEQMTNAYDASEVAKTSGGDTIHYYQPETDDSDENKAHRNWNHRIKAAFDKDLFILYFQPIVSIQADSEPRYEALLRMQDEDDNIISPGTFLPFAERAGLMSDIDRKVIVSSIEQGLAQQEDHLPELFIKLSGKSVDDKTMPSWIAKVLSEYDFPAGRLVFEITESIALHHLVQTRNLCTKLKELGCKIALDHFGTRFKSFKLLESLQVDYIKIDGSLVQHLALNKGHQAIVKKIVKKARKNDIHLIAESVQEAAFLPIIWQYEIPFVQGYFMGVPTEKMDYDFRNLLI